MTMRPTCVNLACFRARGPQADRHLRALELRQDCPSGGACGVGSPTIALFKRRRSVTAQIYGGDTGLEVKGESHYQSVLEAIAGPKTEDGYDPPVDVVLIREPDNTYDPLAIAVHAVSPQLGQAIKVGYVAKEVAARMSPALDAKNAAGETVGLLGRIRGGWLRSDGDEGHYGIWLMYDPSDFGLE